MMYDGSDRGLASIARAAAMAVALCFSALASRWPPIGPDARASDDALAGAAPKGEFDDQGAMELASGQTVKTDCSVNWTAPDGKVYCFSTEDSKATFLKNPDENIQKAKEFFLAQGNHKSRRFRSVCRGRYEALQGVHRGGRRCGVKKMIAERRRTASSCSMIPSSMPISTSYSSKIEIVRGMEGYGWFANTIFHDKDEPKKQYAIDFWYKPEGDKLNLMDIRVQKGPSKKATTGSWSRACPWRGGGFRCRSIPATWR